MVSVMIALARFWNSIRVAWRDPAFRLVAALVASLLVVGTLVFHRIEQWGYLDSFYFSAITLTTVGYGDFSPHTNAGKLLAVLYVFCGVGLLVAMLSLFANALIQSETETRERIHLRFAKLRGVDTSIAPSTGQTARTEPTETDEERLP